MVKLKIVFVGVIVSFVFLCGAATAENRAGAFSVSPHVGWYVFDERQDIDCGPLFGLGLGYNFTEHWTAELMADYILADEDGHGDDTVHGYMGHIDALYHFMPYERLVPYVAVGLGAIHLNDNPNGTDTQGLVNYGGGLKYFITESIALRGDVRHVIPFDDADNNLACSLGVTFLFGGGKKAPGERVVDAIELRVEFDFDKAVVRPAYHQRIKKVADYLERHPDVDAVIEGHTDSRGNDEYNRILSQRRASAVRQYLIDKFDVSPSRLSAKGYGEAKPIADNNTNEGRQRNRRVIAVFLK